MLNRSIISISVVAILLTSLYTRAQSPDSVPAISSRLATFQRNHPIEKTYLQFDKPYYAQGDTLWFKAYLLNNALLPSTKSGILHIDIFDDSDRMVKQYKFPVVSGLSLGSIGLDEKSGFTGGAYTIRAYTNWMRNWGSDYFFYKTIYVAGSTENNFLVNARFQTSRVGGADVLSANLQLGDMNKIPYAAAPLHLNVMSGGKRLYRKTLQTGVDGALNINFNLPQKADNLVLVAEDEKKDKKAVIPVVLNRPENADVQFLPEGGQLVAGLPAHVGFKAIGEDGKGLDVSGIIVDREHRQVAQFKSLHKGMGSFDLPVNAGEIYMAKVTLPGGMIKDYALPVVKDAGTMLKVKNPIESDSLTITATANILQPGNNYFLTGSARGKVCYATALDLKGDNVLQIRIAKNLFPTGIAHIALLGSKDQPLNERLVFIDHHDNLNIKLTAGKAAYGLNNSAVLHLKVTDHNGKPVAGNFSLAVMDGSRAKADPAEGENIVSRMLLTSNLKGYIEDPGYYLSTGTPEAWQALDNLLLTQGWIGYDWSQVFNPPVMKFKPERELEVSGSVLNIFNKPVKRTNVLLLSKSPAILMDTLTNDSGRFVFSHFPRVDTPIFVLKAVNKNGKSNNVRIAMDEVTPPDFIRPAGPRLVPWYVNSDTALLNYTKTSALIRQQQNLAVGGHMLKEVKITAKKIIPTSQNLNGPGNADVVLDENDLEAAGKKTWLQLLQENVKGFRQGDFMTIGFSVRAVHDRGVAALVADSNSMDWYFINQAPIRLVVDGIMFTDIYPPGPSNEFDEDFSELKNYLQSHTAEDIKGIEVMFSGSYTGAYHLRYYPSTLIAPSDIAFVEITTRGGGGPVIDHTPGMYLYKPLPILWPKQFYNPRYNPKDSSSRSGLPATIDWEPNITTNNNGEAKVWFHSANKQSAYMVTVEGIDMQGHLAFKRSIVKAEQAEKDNDGQANITAGSVAGRLSGYLENHPAEKAYLQFDKPYYAAGDTIYFKAYVTAGELHKLSTISGVLHVDLVNTQNKMSQSIKLQLDTGIAWGDFALSDSLPAGNYRIRAYTRWMRNQGDSSFFEKTISIASAKPAKIPESMVKTPLPVLKPDIQFLPEGGTLVTGINNKMAFKAIGPDGLGAAVKGIVKDNEGKQVAAFVSQHMGMGYFYIRPQRGETYTAEITYANGNENIVSLPKPEEGIALAVDNDSIPKATVVLTASDAYFRENKGRSYTLLIASGGLITTVNCRLDSNVIKLDILKRKLHTGIATATLFSAANEPIAERLFFVQNYDRLDLQVSTEKAEYTAREKVSVHLKAVNRKGENSAGHFSATVVNENIVPENTMNEDDILTRFLLTSDLKGNIEQPGYYFADTSAAASQNLDLLMLTQGYRRFEWKQVLDTVKTQLAYQPENGISITGSVTNMTNKPVGNGTVTLISLNGSAPLTTKTDENGHFSFSGLNLVDSARFVLNATTQKGDNRTKIILEKETPLTICHPAIKTIAQHDSLASTGFAGNEKDELIQVANYVNRKTIMLKQVNVRDEKRDDQYHTQSLAGAGNADQVLHSKDLLGGPLSTSLYLLHGVALTGKGGATIPYLVGQPVTHPMLVVVDGLELPNSDVGTINPSDVETIELLKYANTAIYGMQGAGGVLIITTKRGGGLDPKDIPSVGVLPISMTGFYKARVFYSPKYDAPAQLAGKQHDLRSTIYWQPELKTGEDGDAEFEYYNADLPGTYKVTIEGIDNEGNIGRQVYRYQVK